MLDEIWKMKSVKLLPAEKLCQILFVASIYLKICICFHLETQQIYNVFFSDSSE